jgi:CheY-like chemotaxis protein
MMDGLTFIVVLLASMIFGLFLIFFVLQKIAESSRATVLLVDDDRNILYQLEDFLKERNYIVYTAQNVEDAKKLLNEKGAELHYITIDLQMPTSNEVYKKGDNIWGGVEIFNLVKSEYKLIKPIILSAYQLQELRNDGFETEANEMSKYFVHKGESGNYILSVLKMLYQ